MFISITDFEMEETDNSHVLITLIDSMGQPEETKRFDKTNYDSEKWIQDGRFTTEEAKNTCTVHGLSSWGKFRNRPLSSPRLTDFDEKCLQIVKNICD